MRLGHVLCLIATAVLPSTCESVADDRIQLNCSSSLPTVSVTVRRLTPGPSARAKQPRPVSCCSLRKPNGSSGDSHPCSTLLPSTRLQLRQIHPEDIGRSLEVVTCQGSDVELVCNGSTYPLEGVTWLGPDQVSSAGPSLLLTDVKRDDAGIYSCQLGEQWIARSINLIVEFAPVISVAEEEVRGAEDKDCVLECVVEALPTARVTWFKDDVQVGGSRTDGRFRTLLEPRQNCTVWAGLLVKALEKKNNGSDGVQQEEDGFGNYTCTAENKHGRTSAFLRLVAEDGRSEEFPERHFNMTGFIIGMLPPMFISFYIILKLGYRSRYAEERGEEDGTREERFFVSH